MKRSSLLVAAVAAVTSACVEPAAPIKPVRLGVLVPESGVLSTVGYEWLGAVRLAAEQVNASGGVYDGRPLELLVRDTESQPALAAAHAAELASEGVVGVVGSTSSGESAAVMAELVPAAIPMISCCATAQELTAVHQPNEGFFFRTTPSDELQGEALAYLARRGARGPATANACPYTAFFYRDDSYGRGFLEVFRAAYEGAEIAGSAQRGTMPVVQSFLPDQARAALVADAGVFTDAIGAALAADVAHPELCVAVLGFGTEAAELVAEVDDRLADLIEDRAGGGFALPYHFLVGDGATSAAFAARVGHIGERLIGTVPYHATGAPYEQFKRSYQVRFATDDEPAPYTAQNFDAVFLLALAAARAGVDDGEAIRRSLFAVSGAQGGELMQARPYAEIAAALRDGREVDYAGPSGVLTFDPFGDVVGDYLLWQVAEDEDGDFVLVARQPLLASEFTAQ